MIPNRLRTTRLISAEERAPIPPAKLRPQRFRAITVAFHLIWLLIGDLWLMLFGRRTRTRRRRRLEKTLQHLGMVWIRVAQILSLRGSLLSHKLGLALSDLRDEGGAQPFATMRRLLEDELGQPLDALFAEIEETPFAATTVSQIHRAELRDRGITVAVKIQQPYAEALFRRDLTLVSRIFSIAKLLKLMSGMRWDDLMGELRDIANRELNYYYEASVLRRLAKNLRTHHVHVPEVFHSSRRVLVQEFIQGALLSDYRQIARTDPARLANWLHENNIDPELIAERLFRSVYRQVFEDNLFHGDLNTGNIILLRDSRIGFIDCRSAGSLDREILAKQKHFFRHLANNELDTAAEIYFLLATQLPRVDLATVKSKLILVWRAWETRVHVAELPFEEKSLSHMYGQMNRVLAGSHFAAQWSFSRLTGTWVHLDVALSLLAPRFNYLARLEAFLDSEERREVTGNVMRLPERISAAMGVLHELPNKMAEYNLLRESLMRRQAQVVQGSATKLDAVIATAFGSLAFTVALVLVVGIPAFAMRVWHLDLAFWLGPQLSGVVSGLPEMSGRIWTTLMMGLMILFVILRGLRNRFSSSEHAGGGGAGLDV